VLGTVYYLSPEQVTGENVDGRSDIYALGVVGYFALSGRFPFNAELASAVLIAHVNKTAPPLHEIAPHTPRVLTDIIDRCLAKDPDARFQTGYELRDALAGIESLVIAEVGERAANSQPLAQQALLSDTEAQEILARAADLQAATGIQPRPSPVIGTRDPQRHVSETSGHRLGNVRDAALEAGISGKYVDHALLEHGLTPMGTPADAPIGVTDRGEPESKLAGGRIRFEYEVVVDGEMPFDDIDLLVDVIRQNIRSPGQVGTVGRSFTWQGQPQRSNLSVSVLPRGGKTTIRVSDNMRAMLGGLFGGIMGGVGGGTAGVWIGIAAKYGGNYPVLLGGALWGGAVATTYLIARTVFAHNSRRMEARLTKLAEKLAVQVRESVEAQKAIGASGAARLKK
jgi:eukaryotic-like serine/threonine-protein kinase